MDIFSIVIGFLIGCILTLIVLGIIIKYTLYAAIAKNKHWYWLDDYYKVEFWRFTK